VIYFFVHLVTIMFVVGMVGCLLVIRSRLTGSSQLCSMKMSPTKSDSGGALLSHPQFLCCAILDYETFATFRTGPLA